MLRYILILAVHLLYSGTDCTPQDLAQFECPGPGLWSDPENCQCYYNCANDIAYPGCCPEGDMWSDELHVCDFDANVDCGGRPRPGGSTGPSTTEHTTVTTATKPTSTTSEGSPTETTTRTTTPSSGSHGFPHKVLGFYIVLADDSEPGYNTGDDWTPRLYPYQQQGANVLFFTFVNPASMEVPLSFKKLAATRGTGGDGAIPADTLIIFAIGGYAYSINPNPWEWLTSQAAAEAMAVQVATWKDDYGIDGIDLDLEEGAGSRPEAGPNMVHFVRKLKSIHPDLIISQPTYGYPQIQAEIDVINQSWDRNANSLGIADSIGLMVYEGTQSLNYVKNYAEGTSQWEGFPIQVNVPKSSILLGAKGSSSSGDILTLARESVAQDILGIMVWFCSVRDGAVYGSGWDCSDSIDSQDGYLAAMEYFRQNSNQQAKYRLLARG